MKNVTVDLATATTRDNNATVALVCDTWGNVTISAEVHNPRAGYVAHHSMTINPLTDGYTMDNVALLAGEVAIYAYKMAHDVDKVDKRKTRNVVALGDEVTRSLTLRLAHEVMAGNVPAHTLTMRDQSAGLGSALVFLAQSMA